MCRLPCRSFSAELKRSNVSSKRFTIVEKVVSPLPTGGLFNYDRQAAVIFELRHFPRYFDFTERMLLRLKKKWTNEQPPHAHVGMLIEEVDLTLKYIESKK